MKRLQGKVDKLAKTNSKDEQVKILQEINDSLLSEYELKIEDKKGCFYIEPLRVEAYYYHPEKFEDSNAHTDDKQKNNFGKLYIHRKGRGGVDICLSNSEEYYLSFLIKNSQIRTDNNDGEPFLRQRALKEMLKDIEGIDDQNVLAEKVQKSEEIVYRTVRKGLISKCYKNEYLASLIKIDNLYDFEPGYGKGKIVVDYVRQNESIKDIAKFSAKCRELLGYNMSESDIIKLNNEGK